MKNKFFISIDLGGTNLRTALIEQSGENFKILKQTKIRTEYKNEDYIINLIQTSANRIIPPGIAVSACGIGIAGMVSGKDRIIKNAPNLNWKNFNLKQALEQKLNMPVEIINDVNSILWGEFIFGAAKNTSSVLGIFMGTGIGAAIISNGNLIEGFHGTAAELGHMKTSAFTNSPPRICGCGKTGCIEAYLGGGNIKNWIKDELARPEFQNSPLSGITETLHPGHVDLYYSQNDELALYMWNGAGKELGRIIANAVTLLDPGTVMIGGTVWENSPNLQKTVVTEYKKQVNPSSEAEIISPFFKNDEAGLLGAAHKAMLSTRKT